jgi:hypothetical protein
MPAINTVTVSVDLCNPLGPAIKCDPDNLHVDKSAPGSSVVLTFQCATSGWVFPNVNDGEKHFYGISLASNPDGEFSNPTRSADGMTVTINDTDDTTVAYSYTARLLNTTTGQTLGVDPAIVNGGE